MEYFFFPFKWQDEDAFFTDYAASHKKLSELGFTPPSSGSKGAAKSSKILAQSAVVVAVAAAVVILSYFYEIHRRIKWTRPDSVEFYKMGEAISILQPSSPLL